MPNKPRPIGNKAKGLLEEAEFELAAAWAKAAPLSSNEVMERSERQLIAAQVRACISEARRLIVEAKVCGD